MDLSMYQLEKAIFLAKLERLDEYGIHRLSVYASVLMGNHEKQEGNEND